jgi:hypothetical protein
MIACLTHPLTRMVLTQLPSQSEATALQNKKPLPIWQRLLPETEDTKPLVEL